MEDSKFLSLGWKDFAKGLIVAVLTPVFVVAQQSFETGTLTFDWHSMAAAAIAGALAYFTKNFFTAPKK
jgi:hypothetical protein